jgi:hypothetical protein
MAGHIYADATRINGCVTYFFGVYVAGNATLTYDLAVAEDANQGNFHKVEAGLSHHNSGSYLAVMDGLWVSRGTGVTNLANLYYNGTGNMGSFSFSKTNATTVRIHKSAGTYSGPGYGFVRLTSV